MLGRKRGGLEQAAFDYAEALAAASIPALNVISPRAWIRKPLAAHRFAHQSLFNLAGWDIFAARRLRRMVERNNVRAILCHGNRALKLALLACKGRVPVIAIAHNYNTKRFARADHCFAITRHVEAHLKDSGCKSVTFLPNMVRLPALTARPEYRTPPVIGAMGRFHPVKGFDLLIHALAIATKSGFEFRAILAGEGDERPTLEALIRAHKLEDRVILAGWVTDKAAFFESIDLFVLPSRKESFGLAMVEAMAHCVPVITTDTPGPRSIAHVGGYALFVPTEHPQELAIMIEKLLTSPRLAGELSTSAHGLMTREYSREAMAQRLQTALAPYITA
jgi:glycosyltransferase involved in cell wall biosynthesis